ncbi:GNAT family N-acetyltransferase [Kiloniella spongiae]|uniref:GNAT family N-acetyltransferase n=1 Tax=Kiloniella spongiae TaxID=1489064 RepID=UPI00138DD3D0|nr:GNAT family N-acetyltransferase [Kiloniella spongiae]
MTIPGTIPGTTTGTISVDFLRNHRDCLEICADWEYVTWGKSYGWTRENVLKSYHDMTEDDNVEQAFIALSEGKPVGTALLIENDHKDYKHFRPWLAALYVDAPHRRKGVARKLVKLVEKTAHERGEKQLFLYTLTPEIYRAMGWKIVEQFGDNKFLMKIIF